jgi:Type II intron maturase
MGRIKRVKSRWGTYTRARTVAERMLLRIPEEKLLKFCHDKRYGDYVTLKTKHRPIFRERSDAEIIMAYNAELRGFANYYCLAYSVRGRLAKLYYLWRGGLLKTLAVRHKTTVAKMVKTLRQGPNLVYRYESGKMKDLLVFSVRNWKPPRNANRMIDIQPYIYQFTMTRTELIQRLNAEVCEYCGVTKGYFEVHHERKLRDIKDRTALWKHIMIAMHRKTLVLCIECHDRLHNGTLPDWRRKSRIEAESRMR